ncbi:MAG: hypothetical protein HDT25_06240 [Ruminococcus sp.]|nr:hypothetical protein [Ruminococcus sp.]
MLLLPEFYFLPPFSHLTGNGIEVLLPMGAIYHFGQSTPKRVKAQPFADNAIKGICRNTCSNGNKKRNK